MSADSRDKLSQSAASEKVVCRNCGMKFTAKGQYKSVAEGKARCRDDRGCRQRVLTAKLELDLYAQYPRERLLSEMDAAPKGWAKLTPEQREKNGWQPVHTEDERVMAGWIYYSWCFPVSMEYAVQIDEDDEIMLDRYRKPLAMTQERLAQILGMARPNVTRATGRLAERKRLSLDEDGVVRPIARPALTVAERREIVSVDAGQVVGVLPDAIPPQYRRILADLLRDAPEGICTDTTLAVEQFCTAFNEELKRIRTDRDMGIEQVCTATASLLSRPLDLRQKRACAPSPSAPARAHALKPPQSANEGIPDKLQYTGAKAGQSAASALYDAFPRWQKEYPKSGFATPRFSALGKADQQFTRQIIAALGGADVGEFVRYVDLQFLPKKQGGSGRSPYDQHGPKTRGLLCEWAADFARHWPEIQREVEREREEESRRGEEAIRLNEEAELRLSLAESEESYAAFVVAETDKHMAEFMSEEAREQRLRRHCAQINKDAPQYRWPEPALREAALKRLRTEVAAEMRLPSFDEWREGELRTAKESLAQEFKALGLVAAGLS